MTIREEIADALEELEADNADEFGATLKITLPSGQQLPCVPSFMDVGNTIEIGGRFEALSLVVTVRKSLFITADLETVTVDTEEVTADNETPRLRSGKKPVFKTVTYRVLKVAEDPSGAYFKIFLQSAK